MSETLSCEVIYKEVLNKLLAEDADSADNAAKSLCGICPELSRYASLGHIEEKLAHLKLAYMNNSLNEKEVVEEIKSLTAQDPIKWEILILFKDPTPVKIHLQLHFHDCVLFEPLSPFGEELQGTEKPDDASLNIRELRATMVAYTRVFALAEDLAKAAENGFGKVDRVLAFLRVEIRRRKPYKDEPQCLHLADDKVFLRAEGSLSWETWQHPPIPDVELDNSIANPEEQRLPQRLHEIGIGDVAYVKPPSLSPLEKRLRGCYMLLNEAEKSTSLYDKLLRYTCALEQLTTYDGRGNLSVRFYFAARVALLVGCGESTIGRKEASKTAEVLTSIYDERSRYAHKWTGDIINTLKLGEYVRELHEVVLLSIEQLVNLVDTHQLADDKDLIRFYNSCIYLLFILGSVSSGVGITANVVRKYYQDIRTSSGSACARVLRAAAEHLCECDFCREDSSGLYSLTEWGENFVKYLAEKFSKNNELCFGGQV